MQKLRQCVKQRNLVALIICVLPEIYIIIRLLLLSFSDLMSVVNVTAFHINALTSAFLCIFYVCMNIMSNVFTSEVMLSRLCRDRGNCFVLLKDQVLLYLERARAYQKMKKVYLTLNQVKYSKLKINFNSGWDSCFEKKRCNKLKLYVIVHMTLLFILASI